MKNTNRICRILSIFVVMLALLGTAQATPKVILSFDDGWTSVYYKALPIMQANNQSGVSFLITVEVPRASGASGMEYMNLSQVTSLYSSGWDLSSHTVTHPYLTKITSTALNSELRNSKLWLNNSGFTRGSMFLAYPYGDYNSNVVTAVKNNGYLAARTVDDNAGMYKAYKLTDTDVYTMNTLMVYPYAAYGAPAAPPSYVEKEINDTIVQNGLLILSFHNIVDSAPADPEEYPTSDFKTISDFLRSKENLGQLKVVTMSEYFGTIIPTPIPTPTPAPIDVTPPKITITTPTAMIYTEGTTVLANYSCTDETSLKSCVGTVPNGTKINVTGVGNKTFTVVTQDMSGNNNSMSVNYTVSSSAPIDVTPPKITITTPTAMTYTEGTTVLANYSCMDETSLKSCVGTVPNGTKINVTGVGNKTFTVVAQDMSGNNNSMSVNYTVSSSAPTPTPAPIPTPIPTPISKQITVRINASADTYVSSKSSTRNYGTANFVYVDAGRMGYFKYNVSIIPSKANISSAELHDFISWSQTNGTAKIFAVTGTWTETGIKWSTRPTNESVNYGVYNISKCNTGSGDCAHVTKGFENIVQRWVNGSFANNGFMITTAATISSSEIDARESGHIPYLSVTYT